MASSRRRTSRSGPPADSRTAVHLDGRRSRVRCGESTAGARTGAGSRLGRCTLVRRSGAAAHRCVSPFGHGPEHRRGDRRRPAALARAHRRRSGPLGLLAQRADARASSRSRPPGLRTRPRPTSSRSVAGSSGSSRCVSTASARRRPCSTAASASSGCPASVSSTSGGARSPSRHGSRRSTRPTSATAGRMPVATGSRPCVSRRASSSGGPRPTPARSTRTHSCPRSPPRSPRRSAIVLRRPEPLLPWANLDSPSGARRETGITGSLIANDTEAGSEASRSVAQPVARRTLRPAVPRRPAASRAGVVRTGAGARGAARSGRPGTRAEVATHLTPDGLDGARGRARAPRRP